MLGANARDRTTNIALHARRRTATEGKLVKIYKEIFHRYKNTISVLKSKTARIAADRCLCVCVKGTAYVRAGVKTLPSGKEITTFDSPKGASD
jgi:hypothetical protein